MSSYVSSAYSLTFMTWLKPGTGVQATLYLHWNKRSSYVVPRSRAGIFKINPIPFFNKGGSLRIKALWCDLHMLNQQGHTPWGFKHAGHGFLHTRTTKVHCTARQFEELYSGNGDFVGANKELTVAMNEMDQISIHSQLANLGVSWTSNPPAASHMAVSWERLVRSIRAVLTGLLQEHACRLDSESFHTLLSEVEKIVNHSRPITTVSGDPTDLEPLTPSHILTRRSQVTLPPPGVFQRADIYMRKRWCRVQHLANLFWSRWKKEYLVLLQNRQNWQNAEICNWMT